VRFAGVAARFLTLFDRPQQHEACGCVSSRERRAATGVHLLSGDTTISQGLQGGAAPSRRIAGLGAGADRLVEAST